MDDKVVIEGQGGMDETPRGNRRLGRVIIGGVVVVAMLVAAAFVGGQMLNGTGARGGLMQLMGGMGGGREISLEMKPAKELPPTQPDVFGLYQSRSDNALKVGTGKVEVRRQAPQNGQGEPGPISASFDGPILEVVVTGSTKIYHDVTEVPAPGPDVSSGTVQVQQVVEQVDSLDGIEKNAGIAVWGEKTGDRIVATVLVYRNE